MMAMDIGLGTNPNVKRNRVQDTLPQTELTPESIYEDLEKKRTFLGCYVMTTE
jgi:hypothetical protein